jgi:hypothetical protein
MVLSFSYTLKHEKQSVFAYITTNLTIKEKYININCQLLYIADTNTLLQSYSHY